MDWHVLGKKRFTATFGRPRQPLLSRCYNFGYSAIFRHRQSSRRRGLVKLSLRPVVLGQSLLIASSSTMNVYWTVGNPIPRNVMKWSKSLFAVLLPLLLHAPQGQAQTATISWNTVHQVINGFGAADAQKGASMSSANQQFFYGTGAGQLGLTILRVGINDGPGGNDYGSAGCTTTSSGCAGPYISDMQYAASQGALIYGSPWSPPAAYKTNGAISCTSNAGLSSSDYAAYATWLSNWVQSVVTYASVTPFAISVQNEPDQCQAYDSAVWTSSQLQTFITNDLGPAFSSAGLSTYIFMPENGSYGAITGSDGGGSCMTTSSCYSYVSGVNWHDYDANYSAPDTVNSTPYPSGWASGMLYWETEVAAGPGYGPNAPGCSGGQWCPGVADMLMWAAIVDDRIVNEGANAWLYWTLITPDNDNEGLMNPSGSPTVALRTYMLGQYAKFIRPGFYRIDATHVPQNGVTVSAYKDSSSGALIIIATNYTSSSVTQTFTLSGATALSVMPWITDATQNLAQQTSVSVTNGSFTYTLPAGSITSFVGTTTVASSLPAPPTGLTATTH